MTNETLDEVKGAFNNELSAIKDGYVTNEYLSAVTDAVNSKIDSVESSITSIEENYVTNETLENNNRNVYNILDDVNSNLNSNFIKTEDLNNILENNKIQVLDSKTISVITKDNINFKLDVKLKEFIEANGNTCNNLIIKTDDGLFSYVDVSIENNQLIVNSNGIVKYYDIDKNILISNDTENILEIKEDGLFVRKPNDIQVRNEQDSVVELEKIIDNQQDIDFISASVKIYEDDSTNLLEVKTNNQGKKTLYVSNSASNQFALWPLINELGQNLMVDRTVQDVLELLQVQINTLSTKKFGGEVDLGCYDVTDFFNNTDN